MTLGSDSFSELKSLFSFTVNNMYAIIILWIMCGEFSMFRNQLMKYEKCMGIKLINIKDL